MRLDLDGILVSQYAFVPKKDSRGTDGTRAPDPRRDDSDREAHLDYWTELLNDATNTLELPLDHARPEQLDAAVGAVEIQLPSGILTQARALAATAGQPVSSIFLAAWMATLFRYTDHTDLIVGTRGACSEPAARAELVTVRATVDAHTSFRGLLNDIAEALAEGAPHAHVAFAEILRALAVEPSRARHPIFQAAFVASDSDQSGAGADAELAPCDITLVCPPEKPESVRIEFPTSLLDRQFGARIGSHWLRLLEGALAQPDADIGSLAILTPEELKDCAAWSGTAVAHDATRSLRDLFAEAVRRHPAAIAVELGNERLSYAELEARANRWAHVLRAHRVDANATVAICLERSLEQVVAVLAVLKAGAAYVPIDPAYPAPRRTYMLSDSRARVLLTHSTLAADAPAGIETICVDRESAGLAAQPETPPSVALTGDQLGYLIYTSGSTGQPKGVAMPQRVLTNLIAWQIQRPDFQPGARVLQFSSLSFDVSFQELFTTWCSGGTLVLVSEATRRDSLTLLEYLITQRVRRLFLPFVALRGLAEAAVVRRQFPADLREVYTAGEQLQVDDCVRQFFSALPGSLLENQYGPSESHVVTAHRLTGAVASWPTLPSIGRPIANAVIHILDGRMQRRPVGVPGELYIGGACLARGYLGKPSLTAERFVPDPFGAATAAKLYRTGDLARWMPDGTIRFDGRVDRQVKFRGYRVEPGEIAAVLSSHPEVAQCAVAVREVPAVGPRLVAYFRSRPGTAVTVAQLHAHARAHLPDYMVPSHYLAMEGFPLTPSGKVDMAALPMPEFDRGVVRAPFVAPRTPEELKLARIWSRLLGIAEIGVHDDFFDLGGDSLMAVEMNAGIRKMFGRDVPLGALAQGPTISALARVLGGAATAAVWTSLVPIQTAGALTPWFCVHGGSGNVASFPLLARQLPASQPFYALQWDGLDGRRGRTTVKAMAAHYLTEIRAVQPQGPYILGGQCVGGLISLEMARQLSAAGERAELVVLFDTPNLDSPDFARGRRVPYWLELATMRKERSVRVEILARWFLRLRIRPQHRTEHAGLTMIAAAWKYHAPAVQAHALYIGTGIRDGVEIDLPGVWKDAAMGWSRLAGPRFEQHVLNAPHNNAMFDPAAIRAILPALERAHERIEAAATRVAQTPMRLSRHGRSAARHGLRRV